MEKLTVADKIKARKIKRPGFMYGLLGWVWKTFVYKKYNVSCNINCDIKKEKRPYIFISNHASRLDYIFTGVPLLPQKLNYVAGYNEFHRSHLAGVFKLLKVIPKKNFTPDAYAIKEITRVIKSGGRIVIFPEGMSSISGANQPVALGTGKFIKHFKLPVYYSVIKGGYLTSPKYNLNDRCGKIEVEINKMFEPEDLDNLSPEQIEDEINQKIYHDDYEWNLEKQYKFNIGDNGIEHLEDLLFWCPKCNKKHTMSTSGNTITCSACGNSATMDETYKLTPIENSVIPRTQTAWFNMQRNVIREEVKKDGYSLSAFVKLGTLPKYEMLKNQRTSIITGEGLLTLDKTGLSFKGTNEGSPFEFFIDIKNLPTYGMCTDVSRFYTFVNGEFVEFYPEQNVVEEFFIATEELHRQNGGKWLDFKFEK